MTTSTILRTWRQCACKLARTNASLKFIATRTLSTARTTAKFHELLNEAKLKASEKPTPDDIDLSTIFVNNEIALSEVEVYGFDYDYTLAAYSDSLQYLIFNMSKKALINSKSYPQGLMDLEYIPDFAIRGLHFDCKKGFMMKLDAFHHIQKDTVYHGMYRVPWEKVLEAYSGDHVPVLLMNQFHGSGTNMHQFVDIFAIPEVSLITQVIEYFVYMNNTPMINLITDFIYGRRRKQFFRSNGIAYDSENVFWDVRKAVQSIHSSGELHQAISGNLSEYLSSGAEIKQLLERLSFYNKKLFLISNSGFQFIDAGMTHMVGKEWTDLFDVIIINARKPDFFTSLHRPFRVYNRHTNSNMWHRVSSLDKGCVYSEGNLDDFSSFTGWSGRSVLYFGDHVYADLADATLHHGWGTAAIIPELQRELGILNDTTFKRDIMFITELQKLVEKYQHSAPGDVLSVWLQELHNARIRTKQPFNPQFGSLFRTYQNATYFSRRLHRFADIYTSSLKNLLHYNINHTFYPRRVALAHEKVFPA